MSVSLNVISRSLLLQECWFSNVLFSHSLNIRIVKSVVLVLSEMKIRGRYPDLKNVVGLV